MLITLHILCTLSKLPYRSQVAYCLIFFVFADFSVTLRDSHFKAIINIFGIYIFSSWKVDLVLLISFSILF